MAALAMVQSTLDSKDLVSSCFIVIAVIAVTDVVVLTLAPTKLRRVAVFSSEPEVGPLTGGTEVTLQVKRLKNPLYQSSHCLLTGCTM